MLDGRPVGGVRHDDPGAGDTRRGAALRPGAGEHGDPSPFGGEAGHEVAPEESASDDEDAGATMHTHPSHVECSLVR